MSVCKCTMRIKLTGSGCYVCNPEHWRWRHNEQVDELKAEIERLKALVLTLQDALRARH